MGGRQLGRSLVGIGLGLVVAVSGLQTAWAANPGPQSGSIGLQGTISAAPPTQGATIAVPGNGTNFTSVPITVSGLCPSGLLVKIFDNGIFVGSTVCTNGSYSLQVDLFNGRNDLVARVYDALDQAGPNAPTVTVNFTDAQFLQLGSQLSLSSIYAERGAPPGTQLSWPIQLSGGTGPYAISVDWGDGSSPDLLSAPTAGTINLTHTYKTAGIYNVIVRATDKNGETAFLQLIGQGTGAIQNNSKAGPTTVVQKQTLWWPAVAALPLILVAFWLGRRQERQALRRQI